VDEVQSTEASLLRLAGSSNIGSLLALYLLFFPLTRIFVSWVKGRSGITPQIRAFGCLGSVILARHRTSGGPPTASEYALPSTFFNDALAHPVAPLKIPFA
jgi:hypothetical protein